jgi:hypothetical protein
LILAPPFIVNDEEVDLLTGAIDAAIVDAFSDR